MARVKVLNPGSARDGLSEDVPCQVERWRPSNRGDTRHPSSRSNPGAAEFLGKHPVLLGFGIALGIGGVAALCWWLYRRALQRGVMSALSQPADYRPLGPIYGGLLVPEQLSASNTTPPSVVGTIPGRGDNRRPMTREEFDAEMQALANEANRLASQGISSQAIPWTNYEQYLAAFRAGTGSTTDRTGSGFVARKRPAPRGR